MPRPWKISNLDHRVSRFVSDLRCSSKHGESLVVQTGFPTSLVDLFVKNRDRMNKRNSRKKTKHRHVPSHEIFSDPVSSPLISDPGSPSPLNALYSNREILVSQKAIEEEILSGDSDLALEMMREEEEEDEQHQQQHQPQEKLDDDDNCAVPNRVLKKLSLSIFLMLILALGTNKLALLITLSAFFLIFLEFAGKRFLCLSGARTKVHVQFEKVIDSIQLENSSNYFISTPSLDEEVNDDDTPSPPPPPPPPPFLEDLHLLKQPLHLEEEDHYIDQNRNSTATIQETDNDVFQSAKMASSRRSKSAKLSAKSVKKFVLKKMGGSYKKRKQKRELQEECDTTNIINILQEEKKIQPNCYFIQEEEEIRAIINNCLVREEKKRSLINNGGIVQVDEEEEDDEDDNEEEEEEKEEAERLSKDGEDNEMEVDGTSDYSDQVHVCGTSDYSQNSELSVDISVEESLGRKTKWDLEHCTKWRLQHSIPVVVSLVGLVGGRLIALGLTLGWFLWVNHHRLNHHKPRREEIRDDRGAPRYLV